MSGDEEPRVIWVVDDSPLDAERARRILQDRHRVEIFHDGSAAIERISSGNGPDLILLDWVMPGISGLDVCRFLRSSPDVARNIGIILVTGRDDADLVGTALDAGADDYVSKPFAEPELKARVRAALRARNLLERAEQAERGLREVLGASPDPLVLVDQDGRVAFASAELEQLVAHGRSAPGERPLVGALLADVLPPLDGISATSGKGSPPLTDVTIGDRLFSPAVRKVELGEREQTILSLRDVTAIRRGESRRLDLYSIIAHDLRTPLSSMLLRTEALMRGTRGPLPPAAITDLERMQGNIRSLVELINDFLDLARFEGTGFGLQRARVDLGEIVRKTMEDFQPLLRASELGWIDEHPATSATVHGDPRRLVQVLSNLVANAIKFTPPGGTITTSLRLESDGVVVSVKDTGRGIAPEAIPNLFQRYQRTIDAEHHVAGTGLGLMIVREIIEAHGGTVGVDSTPGQGSTFWFRVPIAQHRLEEGAARAEPSREGPGARDVGGLVPGEEGVG